MIPPRCSALTGHTHRKSKAVRNLIRARIAETRSRIRAISFLASLKTRTSRLSSKITGELSDTHLRTIVNRWSAITEFDPLSVDNEQRILILICKDELRRRKKKGGLRNK